MKAIKKLLTLAIAFFMILTLFPTAVKADTPASYATISINGGTAVDITGYGTTAND